MCNSSPPVSKYGVIAASAVDGATIPATSSRQGVLVVVCDREEEGCARGAIATTAAAIAAAAPRQIAVPADDPAIVQAHDSDGGAFVIAVGVKYA